MITRRLLLASAGATAILPTGVMAQTPTPVFNNNNMFRFDFPSVIDGPNLPRGEDDGLPIGPKTVAAIERRELRGAGWQKLTIFLWGTVGVFTVSDLVAFDQVMPRSGITVTPLAEIGTQSAPKFDPVHQVSGPPRVFRCDYSGPMVSVALPRRIVGKGVYLLACPDGPAVYPRRTAEGGDGLWLTPSDMDRLVHSRRGNGPQFAFATMRPLVFPAA